MKHILTTVAVVVLSLAGSSLLMAQSIDPSYLGVWKLNLAKSKYTNPSPKSMTRTIEAQGNGLKGNFDGIAADGSRIAYSFTTHLDGKPVPISGSGIPGGADMIAVKPLNSRTTTTTTTKGGRVVGTVRTEVSKDGKSTTQTSKITDANGKTVTDVSVYDKQ